MKAIVSPGLLSGSVKVPQSKSCAHRAMIAAALGDAPLRLDLTGLCDDLRATADCLAALGAIIEFSDGSVTVSPIRETGQPCALSCRESGTTLRFLLPVAAALGVEAEFYGCGRLPQRPNLPLTSLLREHGATVEGDRLPIRAKGRLRGGDYALPGNVSSQYLSALLLALPLCEADSRVRLTTKLESAPYVDLTLRTLAAFGVSAQRDGDVWRIPGGQRYRTPDQYELEGDWSSAAFYLSANALGSRVTCENLPADSAQGDAAFPSLLRKLGSEIDVSDTPDLAPPLAVAAAGHPGTTRIVGAARLRLKESDRIASLCGLLHSLGIDAEERTDGLTVVGGRIRGGVVDSCGDHRVAMAAAVAATAAEEPVTILGAEAVAKSYPRFFDDLRALGGLVRLEGENSVCQI